MKKFLKTLLLILAFLAVPLSASALVPLPVNQGGSGVNTISGLIQGNGTAPFSPVSIGSGLLLSSGTLSSTGASNTGPAGQVRYFDASGNDYSDSLFVRDSAGQRASALTTLTYAQGADQVSNLSNNGLYQADTPGIGGNTISLTFNGTTDTYASVLAAWNAANPSNTATLINGTGSDIPDAQTIQFIGGGGTGWQTGSLNIGFTPSFQGSIMELVDNTNSLTTLLGVGNLGSLTGQNTVGTVNVAIDNANNLLSAIINVPNVIQLINKDQSTYNGFVRIADGNFEAGSGSSFFANTSGDIGWKDNSNNFYLPVFSTPSVGDVMTVTSVGGGNVNVAFVPSSGGTTTCPGIGSNQVVFYDGSQLCGTSDWKWDSSSGKMDINGLGGNARFGINGGGVFANVSNLTSFIISGENKPLFNAHNFNGAINLSFGDIGNNFYETYCNLQDNPGTFICSGERAYSPTITFLGSGLDDLSQYTAYSGNINRTYIVTIDGTNVPTATYSSGVGPINAGDSLVNLSQPGTATLLNTQTPGGNLFSYNLLSGAFTTGDSISDTTTGATFIWNSGSPLDTFSWSDGTNSEANVPLSANSLSYGFGIQWGAGLGHTNGDQWSISQVVSYGNMLSLDGVNHTAGIGDLNDLGPWGKVTLNSTTANIGFNGGGLITVAKYFSGMPNSDYVQFNFDGGSYKFPSVDATANGQVLASNAAGLLRWKQIDPTIVSTNYGTTYSISSIVPTDVLVGASGSGATTVDLPTGPTVPVNLVVIVDDYGAAASSNNITVNAGSGNSIHGSTIAQTITMNTDGASLTFRCVSNVSGVIDWKVQ